jgi:hypothetical protein
MTVGWVLIALTLNLQTAEDLFGKVEKPDCPFELDDGPRRCSRAGAGQDPKMLRPIDPQGKGDHECLRCDKTWVSCALTDDDVAKIQQLIRRVDRRPIIEISMFQHTNERPGWFEVRTGVTCRAFDVGEGNTFTITKSKGRWRVIRRERWG